MKRVTHLVLFCLCIGGTSHILHAQQKDTKSVVGTVVRVEHSNEVVIKTKDEKILRMVVPVDLKTVEIKGSTMALDKVPENIPLYFRYVEKNGKLQIQYIMYGEVPPPKPVNWPSPFPNPSPAFSPPDVLKFKDLTNGEKY